MTPNSGHVPWQTKFAKSGYALVENSVPSDHYFRMLYGLYDEVVYNPNQLGQKKTIDEFASLAREWNSKPCNSRAYSGAPVGLKDRRERKDKENKTYLQYSSEFGHYLRGHCDGVLERSDALASLCDNLDQLVEDSSAVFRAAIDGMAEAQISSLRDMYPIGRPLPVLIKVLAYHADANWATSPHFDKSVFTLVLNADDLETDAFRIKPYGSEVSLDLAGPPSRMSLSSSSRGTGILFPGMLTGKVGLAQTKPSPHGVLPFKSCARRHSAIAFLMAPNVDTSGLTTSVAA